ncbi:DNA cytosine methyltransferase [Radicibacter daui]|uniref:DNA cytosine methyltransferase n=1 Tax=Radicibacter daui TaxID=3064829 RepID=UPI004046B6A0
MSLGFEQAGFDVVAAVEIDPVHAAIHKFNFPDCEVIARSITSLTGDEIRSLAGIDDRDIDVVFGGAPCQGFSMIGQRALDDPRNSLVLDFVRIVDQLKAKTFVFENVKGLTVGKHRKFLVELIEAFEARGYRVRREWKVLNAADHGVPQDRKRFILLGAREGTPLPDYPLQATHAAGTTNCGSPNGPTCQDALGDLPDAERFDALLTSDEVSVDSFGEPSAYAKELRCISNNAWHFGHPRIWDPTLLTSSLRTDHTEISRRRFAATEPGKIEPISRFFKLKPNGVSNTLRAGTDASRGAFTSPRPIHYAFARCVTVREMARLHGFPDWFRLHETKWHGARQIGNSVPPPLARAIAGKVIEALGVNPTRPSVSVALGNDALLRMDTSQAAAFWSIENPIGRRNRKSGATKRKQHEIEASL